MKQANDIPRQRSSVAAVRTVDQLWLIPPQEHDVESWLELMNLQRCMVDLASMPLVAADPLLRATGRAKTRFKCFFEDDSADGEVILMDNKLDTLEKTAELDVCVHGGTALKFHR